MWFLNVAFVIKAKNKVGNFIFANLAAKGFYTAQIICRDMISVILAVKIPILILTF